jgi:type IV pilus assembly protein PilV
MMVAWRSDRGFTLIEVMVALTLLAIGLLALAGMQVTAIRTNASASEVTARVALAEGIMEEILSLDGSNPIFCSDTSELALDELPIWGDGDVEITGAGIFRNFYRVTVDDPVPNVATVEVTVRNTVGRSLQSPVRVTAIKNIKCLVSP